MLGFQGHHSPSILQEPPSAHFRHNRSARDEENKEFIDEDILSLEKSGAIKEVEKKPRILNPLQVSHLEGRRKRLIMMRQEELINSCENVR